MALSQAYYNHLAARYDVASELVSLYEADVAAKDAKIVSDFSGSCVSRSVRKSIGVAGAPLGSGLQSDNDSWCFEYLKTEPNQYLTSSGLCSGVENHREST